MHFYVGAGRGGRGVGEDCFDDVGAGYVVGAGGAGGVVVPLRVTVFCGGGGDELGDVWGWRRCY